MEDATVKCWDVSDVTFAVSPPEVMKRSRVLGAVKVPDGVISCMTMHAASWPHVAVVLGTESGAVYMYSGDAKKGKFVEIQGCYVMKQSPGDSHHQGGIVDLHPVTRQQDGAPCVFAVARHGVAALDLRTGQCLMEDSTGCEKNSSCVDGDGALIIGANDGIFYLTVDDGRTVAASFRGKKKALWSAGRYVVIQLEDEETAGKCAMKVIEISKKLIVASVEVGESATVLTFQHDERTQIRVIDGETCCHVLREKSLDERVDALCRNKAFQLALNLCDEQAKEPTIRPDIYKRYGDYLYEKRDFDSAASMYTETIGHIETSYVIQKLLSAQRVADLASYLRRLHEQVWCCGLYVSR